MRDANNLPMRHFAVCLTGWFRTPVCSSLQSVIWRANCIIAAVMSRCLRRQNGRFTAQQKKRCNISRRIQTRQTCGRGCARSSSVRSRWRSVCRKIHICQAALQQLMLEVLILRYYSASKLTNYSYSRR